MFTKMVNFNDIATRQELCGTASGAADFMIIAKSFYTIFLEDVPQLTLKDINVVSEPSPTVALTFKF